MSCKENMTVAKSWRVLGEMIGIFCDRVETRTSFSRTQTDIFCRKQFQTPSGDSKAPDPCFVHTFRKSICNNPCSACSVRKNPSTDSLDRSSTNQRHRHPFDGPTVCTKVCRRVFPDHPIPRKKLPQSQSTSTTTSLPS
jgi:hypothetical protein